MEPTRASWSLVRSQGGARELQKKKKKSEMPSLQNDGPYILVKLPAF